MDRLIKVSELSEMTGFCKQTIYNWNSLGLGPKRMKIGKEVRYRESDVLSWLADQEVRESGAPISSTANRSVSV